MLLSLYNNDIAITICDWFGTHVGTCLGVACFVGGDMNGYGFIIFFIVQLFRGSCCSRRQVGVGGEGMDVKGVPAEW